jgi:hypothetical protein
LIGYSDGQVEVRNSETLKILFKRNPASEGTRQERENAIMESSIDGNKHIKNKHQVEDIFFVNDQNEFVTERFAYLVVRTLEDGVYQIALKSDITNDKGNFYYHRHKLMFVNNNYRREDANFRG